MKNERGVPLLEKDSQSEVPWWKQEWQQQKKSFWRKTENGWHEILNIMKERQPWIVGNSAEYKGLNKNIRGKKAIAKYEMCRDWNAEGHRCSGHAWKDQEVEGQKTCSSPECIKSKGGMNFMERGNYCNGRMNT